MHGGKLSTMSKKVMLDGHRTVRPKRSRRCLTSIGRCADARPLAAVRRFLIRSAAFKVAQDLAVEPVIALAGGCQLLYAVAHRDQLGDLAVDLGRMFEREPFDVGAGAALIAPEIEQPPDALDGQAQIARAMDEMQHARTSSSV